MKSRFPRLSIFWRPWVACWNKINSIADASPLLVYPKLGFYQRIDHRISGVLWSPLALSENWLYSRAFDFVFEGDDDKQHSLLEIYGYSSNHLRFICFTTADITCLCSLLDIFSGTSLAAEVEGKNNQTGHYWAPDEVGVGNTRCTDVVTVAYVGTLSQTERPPKAKTPAKLAFMKWTSYTSCLPFKAGISLLYLRATVSWIP